MQRITIIILFCCFFFSPLLAGELYIWTDENGVKVISETPPPAKFKGKVETEKFKKDDPREIERWQRENAAKVNRAHAEIELQEKRRRANESLERLKNEHEAAKSRAETERKEATRQALEKDLKRAQQGKEDAQRNSNNSYYDWSKSYWKKEAEREEDRERAARDNLDKLK